MRFWIENNKQLHWLMKFAKKNNFTVEGTNMKEQFLPFGIVMTTEPNKIYRNLLINKTDFIPIKNFIKLINNDRVVFCDGNTLAGPFEQDNSFEIGDEVRLVSAGQVYTTYAKWFVENNIDLSIASRYRYMSSGDDFEGKVGTIVAYGRHSKTDPTILYCVEFKSSIDRPVYLVNGDGIVLEEIE